MKFPALFQSLDIGYFIGPLPHVWVAHMWCGGSVRYCHPVLVFRVENCPVPLGPKPPASEVLRVVSWPVHLGPEAGSAPLAMAVTHADIPLPLLSEGPDCFEGAST